MQRIGNFRLLLLIVEKKALQKLSILRATNVQFEVEIKAAVFIIINCLA